jgi:hypothetical protein
MAAGHRVHNLVRVDQRILLLARNSFLAEASLESATLRDT